MKWPFFRKKTETEKPKEKSESTQTEIRCLATNCYFNGFYRGCFDCDLKPIEITDEGKCRHFLSRDEGRKIFYKDKKENYK